MPVFYAASSGHVFGGALRDILVNYVIDRKKEQITAPFRGAKNEIILQNWAKHPTAVKY